MRRRSLLKMGAALGATILCPGGAGGWAPAPAAADLDDPEAVSAATWTTEPDGAGAPSEPHRADTPFNALAVGWLPAGPDEAALTVEVRTRRDGGDWSGWLPQRVFAERHGERFGRLIDLPEPARWVQYRLRAPDGGAAPAAGSVRRVTVTTIRSGPFDVPAAVAVGARPAASYPVWGIPFDDGAPSAWPTPVFVPRPAWGATLPPPTDEGYWPPEYDPFRFITVHHTATANLPPDPAAVVRAIHYYHSYTLGWGDVGYHFLIDPWGTIYQGRGGGDGVVAGHVYSYNRFNLGICLLGQFQPGATDVPYEAGRPTEAALASLVRVAAWAARRYGIDPATVAEYPLADRRQGPFPHVCGHRDWHDGVHPIFPDAKPLSTECPGDALNRLLPGLREEIAAAARYSQPARLAGTLAAFAAYETYAPGSARGDFAYGPNPGLGPSVRFRLDVRSADAHEAAGARATGRFELIDDDTGTRFTADRIGYVGVWEARLARGAFVRGSGRTGSGERADFSLSLAEEGPNATVRLWFTSGPGYHAQGSVEYGRFTVARR